MAKVIANPTAGLTQRKVRDRVYGKSNDGQVTVRARMGTNCSLKRRRVTDPSSLRWAEATEANVPL